MSDEKSGLGKWLAGILAAVISGVILYHLTDKKTPPQPPVVIQTAKADPVPAPQPKPVKFKLVDNLDVAAGQVSEDVKVYIDGKLVADLSVNQSNLTDSTTVEVPKPGNYSYSLSSQVYVNQYGQLYPIQASGEGVIKVSEGSVFEFMYTPHGIKLEPR